jgi:serine/threonine protein kinase
VLIGGGTVGYMAPERLQPSSTDAQSMTPAADIYALGMLFYEMITGKLPGRRSPLPSQARKDVPAAFDDVFDKMTRDDLGERYKGIEEVLEGVYKAFPSKEVFSQGTILLWSEDPKPLPAVPEPQPQPPVQVSLPDPVVPASPPPLPGMPAAAVSAAAAAAISSRSVAGSYDTSEVKTGEIDLEDAIDEQTVPAMSSPPKRKGPPPPPPPPPGSKRRTKAFDE